MSHSQPSLRPGAESSSANPSGANPSGADPSGANPPGAGSGAVLTRRTVLAQAAGVAAAVGAGAGAVAGLAVSANDPAGRTTTPAQSRPPATPAGPPATPADANLLATTSDVPVGGGLVIESAQVVLVQPTKGDIRAYTAICSHAACLVAVMSADELRCPCHASVFATSDGSVLSGPAPSPLAARDIAIEGTEIRLA